MRTTIVPAQITTIEDKVAGNLSFTQLMLLVAPVFLSGLTYAFLPPFVTFSAYKISIVGVIALVCATMAIRIKGRLVLDWLIVRAKYNARPEIYVHGINSIYLRDTSVQNTKKEQPTESEETTTVIQYEKPKLPRLVRLEEALITPEADFHFRINKKGGLNVHIKEIK